MINDEKLERKCALVEEHSKHRLGVYEGTGNHAGQVICDPCGHLFWLTKEEVQFWLEAGRQLKKKDAVLQEFFVVS